VRDDGSFVIPGVVTTGLHDPLAAADEEMTVSRVRQAGFWSGGLATGTFGFVMSTNFPVEFEAVR